MSLLDEFENAFQACLAPYTNPTSSHIFEDDELKAHAENITRFLEVSRQIENHFVQKRAILADQRPELILNEEINELKVEIQRKDQLLNKYHDKLNKWTAVINDTANGKLPNPNHLNLMMQPGPSPMMHQMPTNMRMNQPPGQPNMGPNMGPGPLGQMKPMPGQPGGAVHSPMGHAGSPMMVQQQIRPGGPMVGGSGMSQQMPPQMQGFNNMPGGSQANPNVGGLQGPLAYLERTTSNIGMLDNRR